MLSTALALVALGSPSAPVSAAGTPPDLSLDKVSYETGETVVLTVTGDAGAIPVVILGDTLAPTQLPLIGTLDVGLTPSTLIVFLPPIDSSGQARLDCPTQCSEALTLNPWYGQAVTFKLGPLQSCGVSPFVQIDFVAGDCGECAFAAPVDPTYAKHGGGHALWAPDIARDFVFVAGGTLSERGDGTARLTGVLASVSDPTKSFSVDVAFTGRIDAGSPQNPPAGSPKKELLDAAYVENGGPVDPATWHYYTTTAGTLTGLAGLSGARVDVSGTGPAFQVGHGANGKNAAFGASGWLHLQVVQQSPQMPLPTGTLRGDFNLDLGGDCEDCASKAGDHAFALPGIGRDFLFVNKSGSFEELPNGTARLTGTIVDATDPNKLFDVAVHFGVRMNPGAPGYPPAGSPKKELPSADYVENGGPVDPATWHYYQAVDGTLTGLGDFAGAQVHFVRSGPAFQVGLGANGKRPTYGASGWLDYTVLQQPTSGSQLPSTGRGDMNLGLDETCP